MIAACVAAVAAAPLVTSSAGAASATATAGRQSRDSRVAIAGGDIYVWSRHSSEDTGSGCTTAFVVRSIGTRARGMLTAGHCVSTLAGGPAYEVYQTERLSGDDTEPGAMLGVVTASNYTVGDGGDSAFIQFAPGISGRASLFTGGVRSHSSMPVAGVAPVKAGEQVCYSGAATGEHCGFTVVGWPQTVAFSSPRAHGKIAISNEWRATGAHCTSTKGDSGAPVFIRRDGAAYAVGILSGGQAKAGACPFFFTPVTLALKTLGLRLVKSAAG
ncbi:MAG TPA: S1 family peptidase [Mycobacteriales bacterium]|nr:S1 family peptidase [Mycobacteriales bacterium]